jgi:uncharacterized membrane protein
MTRFDRALSLAAALTLALSLGFAAWLWPQLPPIIPTHFDAAGRPDGWGPRGLFLLLPAVAVATYALMSVVLRMSPDRYNLLVAITTENRERQVTLARRLLLGFRLYAVLLFFVLIVRAGLVALGEATGLGRWFLPLALGPPVVMTVAYFVAATRASTVT